MAEQKLPWKVIIKWFPLIHLNGTVYSKLGTVAGLTWGLPLPVVYSAVEQISESLQGRVLPTLCMAPLDRLSVHKVVCFAVQRCTSILLASSLVVADNLDILAPLSSLGCLTLLRTVYFHAVHPARLCVSVQGVSPLLPRRRCASHAQCIWEEFHRSMNNHITCLKSRRCPGD